MQNSEIYELFEKRKKRHKWVTILISILIISSLLLGVALQDAASITQNIVWWLFIFALIASGIFILVDWRCPKCDKPLGSNSDMNYCHHCGVQLTEFRD